MQPYNNGTKRLKGQYGMISISPYICSDKDVEHLRNKGISLFLTRDLICACDKYLCPVIQNDKIGFINSFAEIVITPKYDRFIGDFNEPDSLIVVFNDNKCGIIDAQGIEMLMGEYLSISLIGNRYAIVMNAEYQKGVVEILTNQITIPFGKYDSFICYDDSLIVRDKLLKGLITPNGKLITPIQYRWISEMEYGLFRVVKEVTKNGGIIKKWGIIDNKGNEILPVIYDEISPIRNNGAVVYAKIDKRSIRFDISNLTKKYI